MLAGGLLYCLVKSVILYQSTHEQAVFFYHELVKPLKHHHAVYMAIFVFVALIFLFEKIKMKDPVFKPVISYSLIAFFSACLLLLSSKLVLFVYLLSIIYYLFIFSNLSLPGKKLGRSIAAIVLLLIVTILVTRNPISHRFRDLFSGDPGLAQQEMFHPGIYFNGIQFRLLQMRLVPEILEKENKWWTGVGVSNAQPQLDSQYTLRNMYLGEPARGDKGYLGYNTHNQFLESLLKNGIPGLLAFLFIFVVLLIITWQYRHSGLIFILLLLLMYACIESVFETQYGIILFTLFPSIICSIKREPTF